MANVKPGDRVQIHYTGTLDDGSVFDSSEDREPLAFTVGVGEVIVGLDQGICDFGLGDKGVIEIPALAAYGAYDPEGLQAVPRHQIPEDIPLEIGTMLQVQASEGQVLMVKVAEVSDDEVVLDANHPLAGKDLTFEIEIVAIG